MNRSNLLFIVILTLLFINSKTEVLERNIKAIRDEFKYADNDRNGLLDAQELREAVPSMMEDDIALFMDTADVDRDGVLTFEEYMHAQEELHKKYRKKDEIEGDSKSGGGEGYQDVLPDELPDDY